MSALDYLRSRAPGGSLVPPHFKIRPRPFPFPGASLHLDFVNGRYYRKDIGVVGTMADVGITFSRATAAWYTNAAGHLVQAGIDEAVREYSAGTCLGLRIEEARTNICTDSGNQAAWTKSECSASGSFTAPDGSAGTVFLASAIAASHRITKGALAGGPAGTTVVAYGCYVYIPTGSDVARIILRCRISGSAGGQAVTLAVTGSGSGVALTYISSSPFGANAPAAIAASAVNIVALGGSAFRISVASAVSNNSTAINQIDVSFSPSATEATAGTANTLLGIWGLSIEVGASAGSYIATTAAAVARAADLALMTGADFSAWYRQDEGCFIATWRNGGEVSANTVYQADDGTSNNLLRLRYNIPSTSTDCIIVSAGVVQASNTQPLQSLYNRYKNAHAFKVGSAGRASSAGSISNEAPPVIPVVNRLRLGSNQSNAEHLNGYIEELIFVPKRIINPALAAASK